MSGCGAVHNVRDETVQTGSQTGDGLQRVTRNGMRRDSREDEATMDWVRDKKSDGWLN